MEPEMMGVLLIFVLVGACVFAWMITQNKPDAEEVLGRLPAICYCLAVIGGFVLLIFTVSTAGSLTAAEIGAMIGYTAGSILSMFVVGRVIQLLQQIRDADSPKTVVRGFAPQSGREDAAPH